MVCEIAYLNFFPLKKLTIPPWSLTTTAESRNVQEGIPGLRHRAFAVIGCSSTEAPHGGPEEWSRGP